MTQQFGSEKGFFLLLSLIETLGRGLREDLKHNGKNGEAFGALVRLDFKNLRKFVNQRTYNHAKAQQLAQCHLKTSSMCHQ